MMTSPTFDITGPLPSGRLAIEASAGTGKTYALASLALRYVVEGGLSVDQLLLVTFTRSAADDLRDRVRRRFAEALVALRDPSSTTDEVLVNLVSADRDLRMQRVEQALTDFDSATITTIHGFATQVLSGQGASAATGADAELIGTEEDLITAVCTDILATRALEGFELDVDMPNLRTFSTVVSDIRNNPGIKLSPEPNDEDAPASALVLRRLVDRALGELRRRHQSAGTLSYSDVLTELRDLVNSSAGAIEALRRRFRVALIDEFQDTDPVQWEFLSLLFGDPNSDETLILVGDPKQSIYSFRGADVHTYLKAAFAPSTHHTTLGINWRSDGALLTALQALFSGATFGDENIGFVQVEAAPQNADLRLRDVGGSVAPGLLLRAAIAPELKRQANAAQEIYAGVATEAIISDLADIIRDHLEHSEIPDLEHESSDQMRRVEASDIAVLIGANSEGPAIQSALRDRGIAAVIVRGNNVLASDAEPHWHELLIALTRPGDPERARSVALGWFIGWSVNELDEADDAKMASLHDQLFAWASTLEHSGVDEFFAQLRSDTHVAQRLLARPSGERDLTDLRHIGSLLQSSSGRRARSAVGLLATLDRLQRDATYAATEDDVFARQIESDARAVQIMTVHRAKGLEFSIVCIPSLYRGPSSNQVQPIYFDPTTEQRTYDLSAKTSGRSSAADASTKLARVEAQWENLRRLYVAATRGKHQSVIWWSRTRGSSSSGLAHVLFARENGAITQERLLLADAKSPADPSDAQALLEAAFRPAGDAATVSVVGAARLPLRRLVVSPNTLRAEMLQAATLGHLPDRSTARLSFSSITAHVELTEIDPQDESLGDAGASDEISADAPYGDVVEETGSDLLLGAIPGSTTFGNLVHNILQRIDFSTDDLDDVLFRHVVEQHVLTPWDVDDDVLTAGLRATIETPLGTIASGKRLRDFAPGDHLNELTFELRFAHEHRRATLRDVGALICQHLGPDDPFSNWAQQLRDGLFAIDLAGHLTGSIDLVLRIRGEHGTRDRYVICDYKTNRLGPFDRDSQSIDYHPASLPAAMIEHHYPLQALLYSVALHRYLRWRVRDYAPASDLGGAAYLFIRGMAGPGTPIVDGVPHGVFPWNMPPALVADLSDLFEAGGQ